MSGDASDRTQEQRVAALLDVRPNVAREVQQLRSARSASVEGSRSIARRLRPSGGLGKELREHPLQVIGLLAALSLLGLRWLTGTRTPRTSEEATRGSREGGGVVGAFAAGLAAAAAEQGGRAVIDALLDSRPNTARSGGRVDETGGSTHDV
jgi:hypothetical protein